MTKTLPRTQNLTSIRKKFWPTLEAAELMLERWRRNTTANVRWEEENTAVWVWASETVHKFARKHYGREQNTSRHLWHMLHHKPDEHDRHNDRVLQLLGFLSNPLYAHRSAVWILAAYKRRFAQFEAMRELSQLGVGLTERGLPLHEQSTVVITWVAIAKLRRSILADGRDITDDIVRQYWEARELKYRRKPTEVRWDNFLRRYAWFMGLNSLGSKKPYREDTDIGAEHA